jgi:Domain of unknown function (DUF4412)
MPHNCFYRPKIGKMKKLTLMLIGIGLMRVSYAQFEGILLYDCTIKNKTLTTIYVSKTKVLLEAKTFPMKDGVADISAGKEEDDLLFDFEANKATRLNSRYRKALTQDMAPVTADKLARAQDADITITDLGAEKVDNYNCHHFTIRIKGGVRDLWVTKDLGTTPLYMISLFDYFPVGSVVVNKLKDAGGEGIVVKSQSGNIVVNLANVQRKTVPPSFFQIPAGYSIEKP